MDNKLEDKLRQLMNDPPSVPYDPEAWDKMEQRLTNTEGAKPASSTNWMSLLPFLFLILFLGSASGTYFLKYNTASEKLLLLKEELKRARAANKTTNVDQRSAKKQLIIDTIYQKHMVLIYDTTFVSGQRDLQFSSTSSSNTHDQRLPTNTNSKVFSNSNSSFSPNYTSSIFSKNINNQNSNYILDRSTSFNNTTTLFPLSIVNKLPTKTEAIKKSNISVAAIASLQSPLLLSENAYNVFAQQLMSLDQSKRRKGLSYYASYIQPTKYAIGLYAGTNRQRDLDVPDLVFMNNFNIGLKAVIQYGQHFKVVLGTEYFKNNYESEVKMDGIDTERYTEGFPEINPESQGDKFHEVIGDFRYLQIPIAFQYNFLVQKRLQPYLGIGIISRKALKSTITFEYTNSDGLYALHKHKLLSSNFQMNTALAYLGLQFDFTENWQIQLEGRAEMDINETEEFKYEKTRFIKLNTGLQYSF